MTSVHSEDEFGTVPKCARFCLFTRKTNLERYQNVHVYTKDEFGTVPKCACLHKRRIQNGTKMCTVLPVYTKDEFGVVRKYARFLPPVYMRRNRTIFGTVSISSVTILIVQTGSEKTDSISK